jgi:transcriptional antiterminator NusG
MTMQHRRNGISGEPIEIRPFADFKQDKAIREKRIKIAHIGMAAKRIADDYPNLAQWFCLRVVAGREFLVEEALTNAKVHALVPTRVGDKIMKRHRIIPAPTLPVLPGYVLVRCVPSAAAMMGLRRFERVLDIVGGADRPYRIPLAFIEKFIQRVHEGAYDHRPPDPTVYEVGEAIKVTDGPFASFPGTVIDWDGEKNRVKVEVMIFGRETPVELDVAQIEKV